MRTKRRKFYIYSGKYLGLNEGHAVPYVKPIYPLILTEVLLSYRKGEEGSFEPTKLGIFGLGSKLGINPKIPSFDPYRSPFIFAYDSP